MGIEELQDLISSISVTGKAVDSNQSPLSPDELDSLITFCDIKIRDKELDVELRRFYLRVINILITELQKVMH